MTNRVALYLLAALLLIPAGVLSQGAEADAGFRDGARGATAAATEATGTRAANSRFANV